MPDDFSALEKMVYSGRGITAGMTPKGSVFVGYTLTGRSPSSQARELVYNNASDTIITSPTDSEVLAQGNAALLLYPAIVRVHNVLIASNGVQTNLIYSALMRDVKYVEAGEMSAEDVLAYGMREEYIHDGKNGEWIDIASYEPDAPNNTPRISAVVNWDGACMHIVRCKDGKAESEFHPFDFEVGHGKVITIYKGGNEKPLLPFVGEPLDVRIESESAEDIAESLYAAIYGGQFSRDNYRVAAAVMLIDSDEGSEMKIISRSERGG